MNRFTLLLALISLTACVPQRQLRTEPAYPAGSRTGERGRKTLRDPARP
jgi:hypothetical protein